MNTDNSVLHRCKVSHGVQVKVSSFVRTARENSYLAGMREELDAQKILANLDVTNRQQMFWAFRSLLCSDREQWESFNALFETFWSEQRLSSTVSSSPNSPISATREDVNTQCETASAAADAESAGAGYGDDQGDSASQIGASDYERMESLDFQFIANTEQQRLVENLVDRLAHRMKKRIRRRHVNESFGTRIDFRQTMRQSLQSGGIPVRLTFRTRRHHRPRLIILVDVSRSMSIYSTVFLRFARAIITIFKDADAFAFHTKLVHISEALKKPDLLEVKHHLALISQGWAGGTRVGQCLETFETEYGRSVNRRSTVIVVSDGLDTGKPEQLVSALVKIKNRCRNIVWLNPLLGRSGYETKTQSMLAALPHLDLFAPAHNLRSLEDLEPLLVSL